VHLWCTGAWPPPRRGPSQGGAPATATKQVRIELWSVQGGFVATLNVMLRQSLQRGPCSQCNLYCPLPAG
jgi:hypothetical protein